MFTIQQIQAITGARWLQQADNCTIQHLLLDSRRVMFAETSVFFALPGSTYNGHDFLPNLYRLGVRNFLISNEVAVNVSAYAQANFLLVNDTLLALQQVAAAHRRQFTLPVLGITGSNGKTVVKEWLYQLLWQDYHIVRSPKSYNSQVGVPLSVWQTNETHNLAIFEAGISQPHEMERLQAVIQPTIGLFTNIGAAHNEGFTGMEQKILEKLQLFSRVQNLIYCADYSLITQCIEQCRQLYPEQYRFTALAWVKNTLPGKQICPNNEVVLQTHAQKTDTQTQIEIHYLNQPAFNITIPFIDDASVENSIHCCLFMLHLGYAPQVIARRMAQLAPVEMRLELRAGINNCSIINDAYNSDIQSLAIALDFLEHQRQHGGKSVILSDIQESGELPEALYGKVAQLLREKKVEQFTGIGQGLTSVKHLFYGINASFYPNTAEFLNRSPGFYNQAILVKGARQFAFEKIVRALSQKVHSTVLEINLNAIAHNLKVYKSLLQPATKVMVMVKSLSYGSGSYEIANILQLNKADYLSVAYTDEGVALREAGITLPTMVMNPNPDSFNALVRNKLEPEIYSLGHLQRFVEYLRHSPVGVTFPYPVHIKLDTGMHRLGFDEADLVPLRETLGNNPWIRVVSVFSHLAASDDPQYDDFSEQQIHRFNKMFSFLVPALPAGVLRHLLNSSGIARFGGVAQMDMVRLGLGLYGVDTTNNIQHLLANVSTLKTHVSQVKTVSAAETVGYSRKGVLHRNSRIATVGIGYADGLNRRLGNGCGSMWIRGKLAPVIGNICMDMCMLDVTDVEGVEEGDEVIVFGAQLPVQQLARWLGTIPYEIFTGISGRVKRVYFQE
ncbi:bifunctional UDP-N-acetylmuramoyl-tripeptide:D-alanyl-D-alanine ligase/alanine racemase [Sphingobacteriales bacterium UPWRP_1]|nr:hypothetical protein B6N25_09130 [Sphingobacteriales bacterium TSM_CSS]PSJ72709.1 bifunctional UDP-N-acetylmuramoyl-tripeptide:D-alanyl-D-alanine ligase/alanine racemase [Sphingobacteriales bacterium UPWRP_1]